MKWLVFVLTLGATPAAAAPYTETLSNIAPLVFGMHADEAAVALGVPLLPIDVRRDEETFVAIKQVPNSPFFTRENRIFLQFRKGRLTAVRGQWGTSGLAR